ncbi:dTDP-4-dehydrorhamnose reductase [Pseudomonadota bacterium]|nr:dTDP-4-dehydrorhamnose reductase [Pseudomonadota bacterium]
MKVLVLGSNGQLGCCLKEAAQSSEIEILFLSREDLDLSDLDSINSRLESMEADFIVNAAAFTAVDAAETDPSAANTINNLAVSNIAKACKIINAHLIHISTDYIFDGLSVVPYQELSQPKPLNIYGISKYEGELRILESQCRYTIFRSSWIFSEHMKNFLKTILQLSQSKEELNIINDQVGTPTYAHDIAGAIMEIITADNNEVFHKEIFNVSGFEHLSWFEFALKITSIAKFQNLPVISKILPISSVNFSQKAKRPSFSALDNQKFCNSFRYKLTPLDEAVSLSIQKVSKYH